MSKFGGSIITALMKRIYLSLIVLMCGISTVAQQDFYIFIQEPTHQPFYVRMGEVSYSSSAEGHIILSRLKDSVYNLYIGFPRGRGEQLFMIAMNRKDHGYELRNIDGKRQLFDLQTLQSTGPVASTQVNDQTIRKSDGYSALMAEVVDDSAVMYTSAEDTLRTDTSKMIVALKDTSAIKNQLQAKPPVVIAKDTVAVVKEDTVAVVRADTLAVIKPDTTAVAKTDVADAPVTPDSTISVRDKRDIIRIGTENVAGGKLMIYVDRTGSVNDTIRIIIPRKL